MTHFHWESSRSAYIVEDAASWIGLNGTRHLADGEGYCTDVQDHPMIIL
jgi:hypothetical protein